MAFCSKCGAELPEGVKFCPGCGAPAGERNSDTGTSSENQANGGLNADAINEKIAQFTNTKDSTSEFSPDDIQKNTVTALLSYILFLFIVPLLAAKDSKYARFHANQGIVLFIAELACGIASSIVCAVLSFIPVVGFVMQIVISGCVSIASLAFIIIGIVNAVNGRAKELPLIGSLRILQ